MSVRKTRARLIVPAVVAAVAAVVLAAVARSPRVDVVGRSMVPTLLPGDRLALLPLPPRQGRLVVVRDPRDLDRVLVKRCQSRSADGIRVLGDNPDQSTDSRHFGVIPTRLVLGRPLYRYHPPEAAGWALLL